MSHPRRTALAVKVGRVTVGGAAPIVVQSMTNTDTADIEGTAQQIKALARAGSELVRITVNEAEAAAAVAKIRDRLAQMGVHVPLIGDFHFNGHKLLREYPDCAEALAKYRINPGNVGRISYICWCVVESGHLHEIENLPRSGFLRLMQSKLFFRRFFVLLE